MTGSRKRGRQHTIGRELVQQTQELMIEQWMVSQSEENVSFIPTTHKVTKPQRKARNHIDGGK